jgi:hypothetical protein
MLKKIVFSALVLTTILSCSSGGDSNENSQTTPIVDSVAMTTNIDGTVYLTPPQIGGNLADATGGVYGNTYFLLNGYKDTGIAKSAKTGSKKYEIKIAIPKTDISVGTHNFSSSIITGSYYADLNITGVSPTENVDTISGYVTVTSYNTTTNLIKGNFNFTTNNGVDLITTSHTVTGTFSYVLQ